MNIMKQSIHHTISIFYPLSKRGEAKKLSVELKQRNTENNIELHAFPSQSFTADIAVHFFPQFKTSLDVIKKEEEQQLKKLYQKKVASDMLHEKMRLYNAIEATKRQFAQRKAALLETILPLIPSDTILFHETQNNMAICDLKEEDYDFFIPQEIVVYYRIGCAGSRQTKRLFNEHGMVYRAIDINKHAINEEHLFISLLNSDEGFDSLLSQRMKGFKEFEQEMDARNFSTKEYVEFLSLHSKFLKAPFSISEKTDIVIIGSVEEELHCLIPRKKHRIPKVVSIETLKENQQDSPSEKRQANQ